MLGYANSFLQDIEHQRADYAYRVVSVLTTKKAKEDFASAAGKLCQFIATSGLLQALVFYAGKGNDKPEKQVYDRLSDWLREAHNCPQERDAKWFAQTRSGREYRLLTLEVLAYVRWLKRYADALAEE